MMSERINHAPHAPAMHLLHRDNLRRAGVDRALEDRVWIGDGQDHANGAAAERLRTEIVVLRRFVAQPELCAIHGEPGHNGSIRGIDAERFCRSKRRFVKVHGLCAIPY
jgi:hypothetical protein